MCQYKICEKILGEYDQNMDLNIVLGFLISYWKKCHKYVKKNLTGYREKPNSMHLSTSPEGPIDESLMWKAMSKNVLSENNEGHRNI